MKNLSIIPLALLAAACGSRSPYDVSADQIKAKLAKREGPGNMPDLKHLPPGAVKHEHLFKKGDRLPDGTIADADRKVTEIEIPKTVPGGRQVKRALVIEDTRK